MIFHIIPSPEYGALCKEKDAKGSSLGISCTCQKCFRIAQDMLKAEPLEEKK